MRTFFRHPFIVKIRFHFTSMRFYLLEIFIVFLILLLTLSQILLCFLNHSSTLIKKNKHLVSSKLLVYPFIFGSKETYWLNFSIFFVTNKVFKALFTTRNFFRYYFVNICIVYVDSEIYVFYFNTSNVIISSFILYAMHEKNCYILY